jgi:serine protease Do
MKTIVRSGTIVLAFVLIMGQAFSQAEKAAPKPSKSDNIIIHKKGTTTEKITVVIDGDKITVNGKPVDEYKNDKVDIIHGDDMDPMAMIAPMPPEGGWKMFGDDFMHEIHSNKAFLGVMTTESDGGAKITEVTKESGAEKAGLKEGDIITKIGDEKVEDADDVYKAVGKLKPNDKVNISYKRAGKETTVPVTLSENKQVRAYSWNNSEGDNFKFRTRPDSRNYNGFYWDDKPRLGIQVQDREDGKGVKVLSVEEEEAAEKAGLKEDDVITQVNGKNVTSVDDLRTSMKDAKKGDTLKITYTRDNKTQTVDVHFPKDLNTIDL